ncbi:MAG: toll/interleukin-1 receptor domain-containing protein, partial [Synechococcaceae cyanobacterium]|nr:toll/interleukin-1 receptor domain-containing protein [Synechococcaceae cyanobacterium]
MSALFISYTGRDPEGDAWADRLAEWFREWNYGFFRDLDHSHGIRVGEDWRATLYRELGLATAVISLCSRQYERSPWCVGEVAIAVEKGKTVIPIHLAQTEEELQTTPLPLLLQTIQAIRVAGARNPSAEQVREVKQQLRDKLRETLNWRALQPWPPKHAAAEGTRPASPYPGLPAFEDWQAPVFFGRDPAIEAVVQRLASLALRPPALLLLLGASGTGKSSLVRAGVVPRLRAGGERRWEVLAPFTPGGLPFNRLGKVLRKALARWPRPAPPPEAADDATTLLRQLQWLHSEAQAPVLLVIDQFEELLSEPGEESQPGEGARFLTFLERLLSERTAGLVVLATMRTDFLAPLQSAWPKLTGLATTDTLEPIAPDDFGELISGPADRSGLTLQPGLRERLVTDSGGRDALPLLAFTLEKLWEERQKRGGPAPGPRGEPWDLTVHDYSVELGGVEGSVSRRAKACWDPDLSPQAEKAALRDAFLEHLVTMGDDGRVAKRPAPLAALPDLSRPILRRLVDDRLLVSNAGVVEIAHEALLRTWEPLVEWIAEGREELLQRLRVKRLAADLAPAAEKRQEGDSDPADKRRLRRQALEQLAPLAAAGGSESRAVAKEATEALSALLRL